MKLSVNFSGLLAAVQLMEPEEKGGFSLEYEPTNIDKLDLELSVGKDVELKDVEIDSGLLSYKGRQVLLYIKANGNSARFHVSDCSTLKSMRSSGRFERYVVTNDTSGEFIVSNGSGRGETKARLKVCQNCLRQLNYKGCNTGSSIYPIVQNFDLNKFFSTYSSFFPHMPQRQAASAQTGYTDDWQRVSSHYKVEKEFKCEECLVDMSKHRLHLHTHHINGVKSDNKPSNLKVLCVDCHSKQAKHDHMFVAHDIRQLINDLRQEQGLLNQLSGWNALLAVADPGLHGAIHACQQFGTKLPDVGYYVGDEFGELVAKLELAWPKHKFGIAVSNHDREEANNEGWNVVSADEFLANYKSQASNLRW
ncbi:HNH endonuclease [Photobacterium profundum]|uniref:HNH nuclease domain-containing protein n=1 Tax=Photobacterium profundum 3TCK TaxID=314280 RepID=Q1Z9U1_9GAMM|nr:HNH endonuclease [Photobacterium profundum]EAS45751.1 hypothetical protein P3TCK_05221 [Photobacterium profundum 3TCK]PSV63114.1 HNH endonuclease [Photobacterium profundum]